MPLPPGSLLGAYEVLSPLGAGGMGEVYRARDTRLGREVAIKVLPADRLSDERRRRRFLQEARTLSSFNHPHIVTIHEIESSGEIDFIVMELVSGMSLDTLIPPRPFQVGRLMRLAIPIADALAAAHSRGIVHRDLKPANIVVRDDGTVKVLDFGLAKLMEADQPRPEETVTDVGADALTAAGRIAGTVGYMAPEQVMRGRVDARSDIFSFGALLYQMATGRRAFEGETTACTLAAVVNGQPPLPSKMVPGLPRELERVILRCLRKEPERRYQTMLDVRNELQDIEQGAARVHGFAKAAGTGPRHTRFVIAVAAASMAAGMASWTLWPRGKMPLPPARVLPLTTFEGYEMMPTLSPDGQQVAFARGEEGDNVDIHVTMVGSDTSRRLTTGPAIDFYPSWSPDGGHIAFVRRFDDGAGRVFLTDPLGGGERRVSDFPVMFDEHGVLGQISWSPDGTHIAAAPAFPSRAGYSAGIYALPVQGGQPRLLTRARASGTYRDPAFSPDGRRLAFLDCRDARYGACDMMTVSLDAELTTSDPPRQHTTMRTQMLGLAWTRDGRSVIVGTENLAVWHLWRVDVEARGPPERIEMAGFGARRPTTTPSRNRLVFARSTGNTDVHLVGPGASRPLIASSVHEFGATYSPDGSRIAFSRNPSPETTEIWVAAADGSGAQQITRNMGSSQTQPRWSPDGRTIAFISRRDGDVHVWTIEADGANLRQITREAGVQYCPKWSRDGAWLYFTKGRTGADEVWRVSVADGREERVTTGEGSCGAETADGQQLVYRGRWAQVGRELLIVSLKGGQPRRLAECVYGFSLHGTDVFYYPCRPATALSLQRFSTADVRRLDLETGQDELFRTVEGIAYGELFWGPTLSPDRTALAYGRVRNEGEDLMMIEDFR